VLSSEQDGPGDAAGVFALEEEGFGLAVLEAEDLAVTADVELSLFEDLSANRSQFILSGLLVPQCASSAQIVLARNIFKGSYRGVRTFPG
jgi:hypothetical protein